MYENGGLSRALWTSGADNSRSLPNPGTLVDNLLGQMLRILQDVSSPTSSKATSTGRGNLSSLLGSYLNGITGGSQKADTERIPGGEEIYAKGMFHKGVKGAPDTYAFENSPAGIKYAAEHGYSSIDLDMQITKDGVLVNTHWSQPMLKDGFYDPEHKLDPKTKVSDMTFAEISRLRNDDGQSRIHTLASQIALLKKYRIAGDLEAKDDPRFATDKVMDEVASLVRQAGIKANVKSIDRGERSMEILKMAQSKGFWVRTAKGNDKPSRNIGYGD